ncbi:carbohydrate binding domain-containing protein [Fibrobacter sp. UWB10]|uniref:carbohydrate binding domain-containing protein n=1 Tax=Fibrobacter sp. UWB10 TaxID=1896201 RepID=UPI002402F629|nr:carbohydrate binding domain-containing protein [Fibrobacter sp. UWB10]SMP39306.1 Carbohydrate binding domain-containing protein [Fibrobacter sp. UWB10]
MKFFLSIATIAVYATAFLSLVACSNDKSITGIEIGNPSLADSDTTGKDTTAKDTSVKDTSVKDTTPKDTAVKKQPALPLVAEFSVDYSEVNVKALAKEASSGSDAEEPVLLDTFSLVLTQVRSFSSYYTSISVDPVLGLQLWPYEETPDETLEISFTKGSSVEDRFKNIDLQEEGYLKEMGIGFSPDETMAIFGRILINKKYHPFVYSLSNFQTLMLRYHYSQIDTTGGKANLSVIFRVKLFTNGIDFSGAEVGEDSVIHIDSKYNSDLWNAMNERFVTSFQPLRYDYTTVAGDAHSEYVIDIWKGIAAKKGENTIINGNFQSPFTTDWILMNQFGGNADTSVILEKGSKDRIMKVNVTEGGKHSYSVQLIQENVALIAGVQYQCVFTIWSDVEGQITARIGTYNTYETIGFQEHVEVHTTGQSVGITFTPEVNDPFARFELNLGGSERTFWIKEVKVLRIN